MKKWIFLPLFSCCNLLVAQPADSVDAVIARHMKAQNLAGLSVGIVKDGKVFKTKGYGRANLELDVPATDKTVYKLASVSKHMIATAIMKLVQEGKLNLADTVTKFYKDAPEMWGKITIRHLLNHTSGLPRESPAFNPWKIQHDTVLIKASYPEKLVFSTGSRWQYCNLGYFMLADIIRQVSGTSFENYMQQSVFAVAGLTQTHITSPVKFTPSRADGYVRIKKDTTLRADDWIALRPSGAFVSSIADMMKWELAIQHNRLLRDSMNRKMWMDTVSTGRSHPGTPSAPYGYGWSTAFFNGERIVYHGGSLPGFRTIYYRFPERKTAIIILVNSEPADLTGLALEIYQKIK